MAKNPRRKQAAPSKKHLARVERERIQTRYILIGSAIVLILVVGLIVYGILEQNVLRGLRTVATVNGEKISANEFRAYTKYYRSTLDQRSKQNCSTWPALWGQPLILYRGSITVRYQQSRCFYSWRNRSKSDGR